MSTKRSEIIFTLLAVAIDAAMVFLAFLAAYWLRTQTEIIQVVYYWPFAGYARLVAAMLPVWFIIFLLAGLYGTTASRAQWGSFTKIFMAVSAGIMFFVVWVFLSRTLFFSRLIVVYAWIFAIIFVFFGRFIIGQIQKLLYGFDIGARSVIIIGQSETAQQLKHELESDRQLGYKVINGLIKPDIASLKEFLKNHHNIDEMIVADSELSSDQILDLLAISEQHLIDFRLVPNLFEVKSTNVEVETLAAVPIIAYRRTPLQGWANVLKRTFDILASGLALVILSPVFLIVAILIKLDSPGTVFYKHRRLGIRKRHFSLYKFRTMKIEYCTGEGFSGKTDEEILAKELANPKLAQEFKKQHKLKEDPRVTRIGNFLRKTSLDEIPQLINVFTGQLSMVGPRPIVDDELEKYGRYQHRLFIVKPGATGLWQVSGRSDMPYNERVKLDMYYIENWSLWSDIVILVKTFFVMLFRKNAY